MKQYETLESGHTYAKKFCEILDKEGISYLYHLRHKMVCSCLDSTKIYERMQEVINLPIVTCRHVVVKERKGGKIFLIVFPMTKGNVDFHALKEILECKKLEFAKEEELEILLDTYAGNVSIFHTIFDVDFKLEILLDDSLIEEKALAFHPLFNGDTVFLGFQSVLDYLDRIGHTYSILEIPVKKNLSLKRTI